MNKIEKCFQKDRLLTQSEVLQSLDDDICALESGIEPSFSKSYLDTEIRICNKLKSKINSILLPNLREIGWSYRYYLSGEGASLKLEHEYDFELDKTGSYIATSSVDCMLELVVVKSKLLTVEEYANLQKVKDVTVRQWIRRGKLRFAKKLGSQWFIPETSAAPGRGYVDVTYFVKDDELLCIGGYPSMPSGSSIQIFQDCTDKSIFDCIFEKYNNESIRLELNRKEVEKLELEIIASGKVDIEEVIPQFKNT